MFKTNSKLNTVTYEHWTVQITDLTVTRDLNGSSLLKNFLSTLFKKQAISYWTNYLNSKLVHYSDPNCSDIEVGPFDRNRMTE